MAEYTTAETVPMKPQVIADALNRHLRDDAIVTADSGTVATWWARHIRVKRVQPCAPVRQQSQVVSVQPAVDARTPR